MSYAAAFANLCGFSEMMDLALKHYRVQIFIVITNSCPLRKLPAIRMLIINLQYFHYVYILIKLNNSALSNVSGGVVLEL